MGMAIMKLSTTGMKAASRGEGNSTNERKGKNND
jgi:hypothetical protein